MIVHDHRSASIAAASALALGIALFSPNIAKADPAPSVPVPAPVTSAAAYAAAPELSASDSSVVLPTPANVDVSLTCDGRPTIVSTKAQTVAQFFIERNIRVAQGDFVSAPLESTLVDGMDLSYRSSKIITIINGSKKRVVHSADATIGDVLHGEHIAVGPRDLVSPSLDSEPLNDDVVRISRGAVWTVHSRSAIVPLLHERSNSALASGTSRTVDPGRAGLREVVTRVSRSANGNIVRTVLASRIIRAPRARIIERGIAAYASLASEAKLGFTNAMHVAGSAFHMIATAYTAGCYGCSGITALGLHAGFGVIAVDPAVIPLGTHLYIPGYGRAIAGDTGGAIRGNRVDLGMTTVSQAMQFGRRPITVYVLR